jgi:putative Holliday junction resolvase
MRLLGIDYGTKRVGVALSDEEGMMAFPHTTYPNDTALLNRIVELAQEREVGAVVLGHSLSREGAPNPVQSGIDSFAQELEGALGIPVHLEPEHYSTQAAIRLQGRTDRTDASAAALILDAYLTRTSKTS